MKIGSFLFVAYVGYVLGRSDLRMNPALTAVTVLVAMILHGLVQIALPHDGIERIATTAARWWSPALVAVALLETSGIWIPVLTIRWAAARTRIAASAYIIGAATIGALAYYEGFDRQRQTHPPYALALVFALIVAIVPFAIGRLARRRQETVASSNTLQPTNDTPGT